MITTQLRLTTTKVSLLDLSKPPNNFELADCGLRWKQNKLWVKALDCASATRLPAMTHPTWLQDCLRHSQVEAVCLDASISQLDLDRWLAACTEVNKPVFLRLSTCSIRFKYQDSASWRLKRLADWWAALLLLVGLSPLGLAMALWMQAHTSESILERQWRVGRRGQLFQMLKFRALPLGNKSRHSWQRSRLQHLPQLWNVLNGEMSLVGPRPWKPADALRYPNQPCLNALPGMTGVWQLKRLSEISPPQSWDWDYLRHWSLSQDLRLLTRAVRALGSMALS